MPDIEHLEIEQIEQALEQSYGIVLAAARLLKCVPKTVYNYLERYPELEEARKRGRENRIDTAEILTLEMMRDKYWPAIRQTLIGPGKHRGWSEKPLQVVEDNRQQTLIIEKLMVRLGADEPEDVGLGLAGLLPDVVEGEVVE